MIRRDGRRIVVSGPVTLANVARLLEEGRQHLAEGAAARAHIEAARQRLTTGNAAIGRAPA